MCPGLAAQHPLQEGDLPSDFTYERFLGRLRRCNSGVDIGRAEVWHAAGIFLERLHARSCTTGRGNAKTLRRIEQFADDLPGQADAYWRKRDEEEQEGKGITG